MQPIHNLISYRIVGVTASGKEIPFTMATRDLAELSSQLRKAPSYHSFANADAIYGVDHFQLQDNREFSGWTNVSGSDVEDLDINSADLVTLTLYAEPSA